MQETRLKWLYFPYNDYSNFLIEKDVNLSDYKIHFFYHANFPQEKAVKAFFEKRKNESRIGFFFTLGRVLDSEAKLLNEKDQRFLEIYMYLFLLNYERKHANTIEKMRQELELGEGVAIAVDQFITYLWFNKFTDQDYSFEQFYKEKSRLLEDIVVFVEDQKESSKVDLSNESLKLLMMFNYNLYSFDLEDISELEQLIFNNTIRQRVASIDAFSESYIILNNLSPNIRQESKRFFYDKLSEFYRLSYNTEYIRFSILYQFVEILIDEIAQEVWSELIKTEQIVDLFKFKKDLNASFSEGERIKALFNKRITVESDLFNSIKDAYEKLVSEINRNQTESLSKIIYEVRNILFHSLYLLIDSQEFDKRLRDFNDRFIELVSKTIVEYKYSDR